MIDFNHVLLRLTVAKVGGDDVSIRIDGLSRDACSFVAANHATHAARVGYALHVSVELVSELHSEASAVIVLEQEGSNKKLKVNVGYTFDEESKTYKIRNTSISRD